MGALRSFFVYGRIASVFCFFKEIFMRKRSHFLAHSAIIAALYAVLCHFQNLLLPGSATWAIQMRAAEALCILAFFTPAAIPGLGIGCLLFNLSFAGALPLDFLVGTLASVLAGAAMYLIRNLTNLSFPDIAKEFARDHSTVVTAVQKVENMLKSGDTTLQNHIRDITANINSCL